MHDIKFIRNQPETFDEGMKLRGLEPQSTAILAMDQDVRSGKSSLQELQAEANQWAKKIGELKSQGKDASEAITKSKELKQQVAALKKQEQEGGQAAANQNNELHDLLSALPNIPHKDVPFGKGEEDNVVLREVGDIPTLDFEAKEHWDLGEQLGLMDFEQTAKISGSRFVSLKGALAKLERALSQFMLDMHTQEFGYTEHSVPLLVRDDAMFGSGQLPKFAEDSFATTNGYRLIPTSEVPLVNMVRESLLDAAQLPMRLTALTPCFRSEAGAAGRDTRGMIRLHQFSKVEMVSITDEASSEGELERMTSCAEEVLKRLGLSYRVMLLCSQDMGFGANKTYDIEVWLPGQNAYREISSCSNCGDFQARRMNARYRFDKEKKDNRFVHTLNGSGVAVGRLLVAVLENYQNADGSITVPDVLAPYMGGLSRIDAN